eukprot:TRINITY_DN5622_c0_g1_i2.p1 TRINITY_DN5622_c0_g1~~TRINITY_DN5622_c0_g1_i2.p1  ORF type:complete len:589 (-),score=142.27 TRINITY_DN5622_c0_g1_i2:57-1823(-)
MDRLSEHEKVRSWLQACAQETDKSERLEAELREVRVSTQAESLDAYQDINALIRVVTNQAKDLVTTNEELARVKLELEQTTRERDQLKTMVHQQRDSHCPNHHPMMPMVSYCPSCHHTYRSHNFFALTDHSATTNPHPCRTPLSSSGSLHYPATNLNFLPKPEPAPISHPTALFSKSTAPLSLKTEDGHMEEGLCKEREHLRERALQLQTENEALLGWKKQLEERCCQLEHECQALGRQHDWLFTRGKPDYKALNQIRPVVQNWVFRRRLQQLIRNDGGIPGRVSQMRQADEILDELLLLIPKQAAQFAALSGYLDEIEPAIHGCIADDPTIDPYGFLCRHIGKMRVAAKRRADSYHRAEKAAGEIQGTEAMKARIGVVVEDMVSDRINSKRLLHRVAVVEKLIRTLARRFPDDFGRVAAGLADTKFGPIGVSLSAGFLCQFLSLVGLKTVCDSLTKAMSDGHALRPSITSAAASVDHLLAAMDDDCFDDLLSLEDRLRFEKLPEIAREILVADEEVQLVHQGQLVVRGVEYEVLVLTNRLFLTQALPETCLLYTSDAADEEDSVDLGGRRIIKKKKKNKEDRDNKDR